MDVASMLRDTITIAPFTGRDGGTKPTYGAQVTAAARVENKQTMVRDAEGQEVLSSTTLATLTSIGSQDRVWFPGADTADNNQARTPLSVVSATELLGGQTLFQVMF